MSHFRLGSPHRGGDVVVSRTSYLITCFFFFQAEDGIRDLTVTGVQTCALPISQTIDLSTFTFSGGGSEAALIAGFNAGTAYTNIHNAVFPGGEIRGQVHAEIGRAHV